MSSSLPSAVEGDRQLNVPGTVTIGDRALSVAALTLREERALWAELAEFAAADADPFHRIAPVLARLEKEKKLLERNVLLDAAARAVVEAHPLPDSAVDKARRTNPAALARELYRRAKKFHPQLDEAELIAVVTSANVGDVFYQMEAALGGGAADPKATR